MDASVVSEDTGPQSVPEFRGLRRSPEFFVISGYRFYTRKFSGVRSLIDERALVDQVHSHLDGRFSSYMFGQGWGGICG